MNRYETLEKPEEDWGIGKTERWDFGKPRGTEETDYWVVSANQKMGEEVGARRRRRGTPEEMWAERYGI